jgi:hypothetical protein
MKRVLSTLFAKKERRKEKKVSQLPNQALQKHNSSFYKFFFNPHLTFQKAHLKCGLLLFQTQKIPHN